MQFDFSKILGVLKATPTEAIKIAGAAVNVLEQNPALVPELIAVATSGNVAGALAANPKVVTDLLGGVVKQFASDPALLGSLVSLFEAKGA